MNSPRTRRILITGATSGIGLHTALQLAAQGEHIILAARNPQRGEETLQRIVESGGKAEFRRLDLADQAMIRQFAEAELSLGKPLDVLINNAGTLPPKDRTLTRDGFELDFGVGYFGHFALTGLLLPALERSPAPRVISVSSVSHQFGHINLQDLNHEHHYASSLAYNRTKLACLMFAMELHRRATSARSHLLSVAAHPGISKTPIASGWEHEGRKTLWDRLELFGYRWILGHLGQTAEEGARPLVYAANDASVVGGAYYGCTGFQQYGGPPGRVEPSRKALDEKTAAALWEAGEELTGVRYRFSPAACTGV